MNLMTNARDALNERYPGHHPDKTLRFDARLIHDAGHDWIRVTVEDHGPGIPAKVRERMSSPTKTSPPPNSPRNAFAKPFTGHDLLCALHDVITR